MHIPVVPRDEYRGRMTELMVTQCSDSSEKLAYEGKRAPYGMLVFDVELLKIE